ncbi:MAG: methyltransferase [Steroidobacteraceae bacterium]
MSTLPATTDDRIVWDTWLSIFRFPVVSVADEVGTFAAISEQSKTTEALAADIKVDARALLIHLGLLAAMGFVERRDGRWHATAATRTWMHPEAAGYAGPLIHRFKQHQPFHAQLLQTLRTGGRADGYTTASNEWERGEMAPELAKFITVFMNAHSLASSRAVAMQPLFAGVHSVLDVGGGSAIFSIELTRAWPQLRATVLEIAAICTEADGFITAAGAAQVVKTLPMNMFTQHWPQGHDVHFFSNIFHDWSDETCRLLARKSFAALPAGGCIALHEILMDDDGCGPAPAAAFSLLMLMGTKGRQYSLPELRAFLEAAGFVDVEAAQTGGGYYSLVTARKA